MGGGQNMRGRNNFNGEFLENDLCKETFLNYVLVLLLGKS